MRKGGGGEEEEKKKKHRARFYERCEEEMEEGANHKWYIYIHICVCSCLRLVGVFGLRSGFFSLLFPFINHRKKLSRNKSIENDF